MLDEDYYKRLFSKNLKKYMDLNSKTQTDIINDLGFNKSAVSTWCNGSRLPRMDKVNVLAEYFGISRSDLIDDKPKEKVDNAYYLNEETREIAQEIFENPDMKSLFDMSRKMPPERLKAHLDFMKQLYDNEHNN